MFLIRSLSIGQCSQKSVDSHTVDVGEIVFSAQADFDRFVFHVSSARRSFRARSKERRERLQPPVNSIYPGLIAIPMGKYCNKRVEILFSLWESFRVAPQEVDKLISELTAWCRAQHGRQRELAAMLGVSEQLVSNWLARRKTPTLQHGLQIQDFLSKRKKSSKKLN